MPLRNRPPGGRLVHGHHVGHRDLKEPVVGPGDPLHRRDQRPPARRCQRGERLPMGPGRHMDLVGPAGIAGDIRDDAARVDQDATPSLQLIRDQPALQASWRLPAQLPGRHRRDEGIRVDLPMRVMQGDPHLLAAVLKDEHVADPAPAAEVPITIGPDLRQLRQAIGRQGGKRGLVLVGVDHHLAQPAGRTGRHHRRESVLKNGGLKMRRRNLG